MRIIGPALLTLVLAGCLPEKLSKEDEEWLEANAFLWEGIEDGVKGKYDTEAWKKSIDGPAVIFSNVHDHKDNDRYPEDLRKAIGNSKFVKYTMRYTRPEKCVVITNSTVEYSQGASREDFSAHTATETRKIDISKAHRWDISFNLFWEIKMQGKEVTCIGEKVCQNDLTEMIFVSDDEEAAQRKSGAIPHEIIRRRRALDYIKESCPGRKY